MNYERLCYGCFRELDQPGKCPTCHFNPYEEQPVLALPLGTILNGRYMTGRVLGIGGFGITYLGFDLTLQLRVAIKEYLPSGLAIRSQDKYNVSRTGRVNEDYQKGLDRFLKEARILAKFQQVKSIVRVQDYFQENSTAYFVMEYVEGQSLKGYLAKCGGKISFDEAFGYLRPIMEALCQVHQQNMIHRDISPDNIYITKNHESKLLDFGAARFAMNQESESVSVILKHGFAPEEQYSTHGEQGPWTDVYAMAATLYCCITGKLPPESVERLSHDNIKLPSDYGCILNDTQEKALMIALAVRKEERFQSMDAFLKALTQSPSGDPGPPDNKFKLKKILIITTAAVLATAIIISIGVGISQSVKHPPVDFEPDSSTSPPVVTTTKPETTTETVATTKTTETKAKEPAIVPNVWLVRVNPKNGDKEQIEFTCMNYEDPIKISFKHGENVVSELEWEEWESREQIKLNIRGINGADGKEKVTVFMLDGKTEKELAKCEIAIQIVNDDTTADTTNPYIEGQGEWTAEMVKDIDLGMTTQELKSLLNKNDLPAEVFPDTTDDDTIALRIHPNNVSFDNVPIAYIDIYYDETSVYQLDFYLKYSAENMERICKGNTQTWNAEPEETDTQYCWSYKRAKIYLLKELYDNGSNMRMVESIRDNR